MAKSDFQQFATVFTREWFPLYGIWSNQKSDEGNDSVLFDLFAIGPSLLDCKELNLYATIFI